MRVGFGYDVHRFEPGRPFILGGVKIPYEKGLLGHSDADVLTHAVIDALFGAAALGDIGSHFPDSDARYKDISSLKLLSLCVSELSEHGYKIVNIDSTVVLQTPKLSPYVKQICEKIAEAARISVSSVSVKAKTEELLGFTGEGLGVKAYASVLIEKT